MSQVLGLKHRTIQERVGGYCAHHRGSCCLRGNFRHHPPGNAAFRKEGLQGAADSFELPESTETCTDERFNRCPQPILDCHTYQVCPHIINVEHHGGWSHPRWQLHGRRYVISGCLATRDCRGYVQYRDRWTLVARPLGWSRFVVGRNSRGSLVALVGSLGISHYKAWRLTQ